MARGWVWLQLSIAWLPMWALFAAIIVIVHGNSLADAAIGSLRLVGPGAALGILVYKFASRLPWPHPFRLAFVAMHLLAAVLYAVCWYVLICVIDSLVLRRLVLQIGPGNAVFFLTGIWLYIVVAVVAYANLAAQRTAKIETQAARMQLDALRAQLHPHFLFNALNSIIQLAEEDTVATQSALERLSELLRHATRTSGGGRINVTLRDELGFIRNYLALEQLRLGDRLRVVEAIEEEALDRLVPSLILQPIVENAILHAIAPRRSGGTVRLLAHLDRQSLIVEIRDDGPGCDPEALNRSPGMGLNIVRRQLEIRFPGQSELRIGRAPEGGTCVRLSLPAHQQAPGASW